MMGTFFLFLTDSVLEMATIHLKVNFNRKKLKVNVIVIYF